VSGSLRHAALFLVRLTGCFVKLVGAERTVERWATSFDEFLDTARVE
jgi:hypothetical protein